MEQKTERYTHLHLQGDLTKTYNRDEKKLNDVHSFNISINNTKKMITYLKDKNHKSKNNYKKI